MDWNSAIKTALHNARMKQKIAYARNEMFWLVNDNEPTYDTAANIEYLQNYVGDVILEYEKIDEIEQANQLKDIYDDFGDEFQDKADWCAKVQEFFYDESDFFQKLINKYERILGIYEPQKKEPVQLHFMF